MSNIRAIGLDAALASAAKPARADATPAGDFAAALKSALDKVNTAQHEAQALARAFQLDDPQVGLEDTMIAAAKASVSFQTAVQVRNRLVAAYHDIMNMQV